MSTQTALSESASPQPLTSVANMPVTSWSWTMADVASARIWVGVRFIRSGAPDLRQISIARLSSSRLKSSLRSTTALAIVAMEAPSVYAWALQGQGIIGTHPELRDDHP